MAIENPDEHERKRELARLLGVEDHMWVEVEVEGHARGQALIQRIAAAVRVSTPNLA